MTACRHSRWRFMPVHARVMRSIASTRIVPWSHRSFSPSSLTRSCLWVGTLVGLAIVAAFNPWLALILGITVAPMLLLGLKLSSPLRRNFRRARESNSALTSWIQETIVGVRVIKATGTEQSRRTGFGEQSRRAFDAAFTARVLLTVFGLLIFLIVGLSVLVTQSISALLANTGTETYARDLLLGFGFTVWNLGTFNAATERTNNAIGAVNQLINVWGRAQDMAIGLSRVFEILDMEPEIVDAVDATEMAPFSSQISFENITFSYQPDRPVLQDLCLRARPDTVTALVGPTGTGKSTLMSLLLRLADPQAGQIMIDGIDIRHLTIASLRSQISIATQENILFTDTVLENIRYAAPGASRDDAINAARVACADEFICELPDGYDTPLGERATKLSSGQRQRIVIARAIMKDTPILILDEPTSALDAETELKVLDNLREWGRARCIFLITHRLSTIRHATNVVYLRDGRIAAEGAHNALMQGTNNLYRSFVNAENGLIAAGAEV